MAFHKSKEKPKKSGSWLYERHRLMLKKLVAKRVEKEPNLSESQITREAIEEKYKKDA